MLLLTVLGLLTLCSAQTTQPPTQPTQSSVKVSTPRGDLNGFHVDYGSDKTQLYYGNADVFLGIPYAEPPVGEMRFQKTKALCTYPTSPLDATKYQNACPQDAGQCDGRFNTSEDCLYLNVFSPNAHSNYKYPVMVWIHGGSMKSGCAQQYDYKGAIRNLVSRGVVVVTFQYRLGFAGFFTTFTDDFPPNRGMLDQVEAIRWVKDNIQYFGGNPYQITLFGESAGGASVSAHTYSPLSQNLFQQAIMESGVVLTSFEGALGFSNLSETRAFELCNYTDVQWSANDWGALKTCLAKVTPADWLPLESDNLLGWQICQDDYFFPDVPRNLAKLRPNIPIMLGSNKDEWAFFWLEMIKSGMFDFRWFSKGLIEVFFDHFGGFLTTMEKTVLEMLEQVYLPPDASDSDPATWFKAGSDMFTAAGFTGFIIREIDHYMANGNPNVYLWEQTYASNVGRILDIPGLGYDPVPHVAEVYFVWMQDIVWDKALKNNSVVPFDYQLADFYGESWTNFAKYGTPSVKGDWKPVPARRNNQYFRIDNPTVLGGMTMQNAYRYTDDVVWTKVIPSIAGAFPPEKPDYNNGTNTFVRGEYNIFLDPIY